MLTWIKIRWAAFKLGVRDRGLAAVRWYWNPKLGVFEERVQPHSLCGTPLRVGIVKSNDYLVHWCYRCTFFIHDEDVDGPRDTRDSNKVIKVARVRVEEKISPEAKKLTNDLITKMKNSS